MCGVNEKWVAEKKVHSKTDEVFVVEWIRKCEGKERFTLKQVNSGVWSEWEMSGREKVHSKTDEVFVAEWIRKCEGKERFTPKKEIKKYRVRGSRQDKYQW